MAMTTLAVVVLSTGGLEYRWRGHLVRATDATRPALLALAVLAVRLWMDRSSDRSVRDRVRRSAEYAATRGMVALLAATCLTYAFYHVRVCGGLDPYGYVSASELIAAGTLREDQPLASLLPFGDAARAAAPLGFVVAADGHSRVPRFPLGLPLVMALFRVLGPSGPFLVPFLMAWVAVAAAYRMAREPGSPATGLFAACVLAASPTFANLAMQPMSDVPATCWLVLAAWLTLGPGSNPILGGICAGVALLTRPPLITAIGAMLLLTIRERTHALRFGVAIAPFVLAQAALNEALYGGFLSSGYGTLPDLFRLPRILTNLWNILKWTTVSHTALIWVAWLAGIVALRQRRWPVSYSIVAVAVALPYLLYLTYDDWESTRFVLPGLALVLLVAARGVDAVIARWLSPPARAVVLLLVATGCMAASHRFLQSHLVFDLWRGEAKYEMVGSWFRDRTPPRTVVLSSLHSGGIRYYGHRETVRWDMIPEGSLLPTLKSLATDRFSVYLALDMPSEANPFHARFASELPAVVLIPAGTIREVNLYELKALE